MSSLFSHIDLRVRELERAIRFYDEVLGEFGFRRESYPEFGDDEATWRRSGWSPNDDFFGIVMDPQCAPNANRIALRCDTPEHVARVADAARRGGGAEIDGPAEYDGYHAVFFEDPDGNRLEACFLKKHGGLAGDPYRAVGLGTR